MNSILIPSFSRRGLIAGAAGLLATAPIPVLAQQTGGSGGPSAVIDVNRARTEPIPIAVPDLGGADGASEQMGRDIAGVITNDLGRSGLFKIIDRAAFIQAGASGATPNLQNWRPTGAQALVTGSVQTVGGGQLRVEFRLWDI